jgi:arylsulfatase A-like enzyme
MKSSTKRTLSKAPLLSLWTSVLLATVQCSGPGDSEPLYPPNVLLITLDTLRADHLGCYGYDRPTSPNIDAFAKVATFYPRGYASAPWTLPTHGSLMTGLYPFEHGAHTFKINEKRAEVGVLADRHVTLAETLRAEGFQTAAFVGNDVYLKQRFKIHQGFETYFSERTYADQLNAMAFEWL